MKTVVIKEAFDAYPNGTLRSYAAGDEVEVSNELADNIVGKGLAREKPGAAPEPEPAPADHQEPTT